MRMIISSELRYAAISMRLAAAQEMDSDTLFSLVERIDNEMSEKWFNLIKSTPQENQELPPIDTINKPLILSHYGIAELRKINNEFSKLPIGSTLFDVLSTIQKAAVIAKLPEMAQYIKERMSSGVPEMDKIQRTTNDVIGNPRRSEEEKKHMRKSALDDLYGYAKKVVKGINTAALAWHRQAN